MDAGCCSEEGSKTAAHTRNKIFRAAVWGNMFLRQQLRICEGTERHTAAMLVVYRGFKFSVGEEVGILSRPLELYERGLDVETKRMMTILLNHMSAMFQRQRSSELLSALVGNTLSSRGKRAG